MKDQKNNIKKKNNKMKIVKYTENKSVLNKNFHLINFLFFINITEKNLFILFFLIFGMGLITYGRARWPTTNLSS